MSDDKTKGDEIDSQYFRDHQIQGVTQDIFTDDSLDPVYQTKARILNDALQEIGMGKYQVRRSIHDF